MLAYAAIIIFFGFVLYVAWACTELLNFRKEIERVLTHIKTYLIERRALVTELFDNPENNALNGEIKEKLQDACRQAKSAKEMDECSSKEHLLSVIIEEALSRISKENEPLFPGFKESLKTIENKINETGRQYNQLARMYNSRVEHFPMNIFARIMGFKELVFFNL